MIRYFCDCCNREIPIDPIDPLGRLKATVKGGNHSLTVSVITSKDGTANSGHFCKYCVLDAIATLDDRPKDNHVHCEKE